ncbi:MAG: hypothetical protein WC716_14825 [Chitinophagaceae bacterium]|jgi:hypothetical protein
MDNFKNYIDYCLSELIERASEAASNSIDDKTEFHFGYTLAYNEVITFLLSQTEIFQLKGELSDRIKDANIPL